MVARPFDCAGDVLRDRRRELHEFAAGAFKREAMLVFAARWVWPKRRNAAPALAFDRLRPPGSWRAVRFRRQPLLNMPAIHGGIFWVLAQLRHLREQGTGKGV